MSDKQPKISLGEGLAIVANLGVIVGLLFCLGGTPAKPDANESGCRTQPRCFISDGTGTHD